ncbi:hypothetical protein VE03_02171 [Pseudogymnoascus sp. 23342-1-I1]|nr:hypothetical protein VE03_02171 [Pseudogymnoascus sp. 23342-1-I1]
MFGRVTVASVLLVLTLAASANAQFGNMFEQFMGGQQQQRHHQAPQNVASDSAWYQQTYSNAHCSNYLCPGTLSCVSVPHHCPCQFPAVEDKFELGDGSAICVSKGGFKANEAARKVELARKGLL